MIYAPQQADGSRRSRFAPVSARPSYRMDLPTIDVQATPELTARSTAVAIVAAKNQVDDVSYGLGDFSQKTGNLAPSLASILRPAGASRWMLPSVAAITPQYIEGVLRGALAGNHVQAWELFDIMLDTDPEIAACVGEYVDGVTCKKAVVTAYAEEGEEPTPDALKKAAVVRAAINNMRPDVANDENDFRATLKDILFARFHGQSVVEVDWFKKDGTGLNQRRLPNLGVVTLPRSTFWVHPVCYAWDMNGRLGLRLALESQLQEAMRVSPLAKTSGAVTLKLTPDRVRSLVEPPAWNWITSQARPSQLMDFPADKFLLGIDKFKSGTVMGSGSVLRTLAWWWIASMYSWDFMLNYAQLFGIPFRKGKVAPNTTELKKQEIRQLLQSMGSAGYILLDQGNEVEFERASSGAGESPQAFLAHFANDQKRKVILRQTMSGGTAGGGSKGVGKSFGDVEADGPKDQCLLAGAQYAMSVINYQFVPYVLNVNFGDGGDMEAPTVKLVDEQVGGVTDAQRDALLVKMINIPASYLHSKYAVPNAAPTDLIAGKDEGVLPPTPGGFGGGGEDPEAGAAPTPDADGSPDDGSGGGAAEARAAISAARALPAPKSVATALSHTVEPLTRRLAAIERIKDSSVKRDALLKLHADLPAITAALKADPSLSEAVAASIQPKGKI